MIKTPLSRRYYKGIGNQTHKRTWKTAVKCWWRFDVLPWFRKMDYRHDKPERPYYRWQKYWVFNLVGEKDGAVVFGRKTILGRQWTTDRDKLFSWDK